MLNYVDLSKQGHSRRLQVCVKPVQNSGTLPLLVEAVLSVSIGCVSARSTKLQRPLDSYQVCETQIQILEPIVLKKKRKEDDDLYITDSSLKQNSVLRTVYLFHASDIQYYADSAKVYLVHLWFHAMTGSSGGVAGSLKKANKCKNSLVPCLFR